jgi:signal transduction histidine kinase
MPEPTQPDKQLTPQAERVLQKTVLGLREIRHPLNALVGYSELLLIGDSKIGPLTEQQREFLTIINRCGKDVLEVTYLLLVIHQLIFDHPQLQFEQVDLGDLIQQFLTTLPTPGEIEIPDNLPHVWLDRERFQQALKWVFWRAIHRWIFKRNRNGWRFPLPCQL